MTEQEWLLATDEEKAGEWEKCKDLVYFYNNYYVTTDANGNLVKPAPITKDQWDDQQFNFWFSSFKWRNPTKELYDHFKNKLKKGELNI